MSASTEGRAAVAGPLGVGVLGGTSRVHRAAVRPALHAVEGLRLVHEASRSGDLPRQDGVRVSRDYAAVLADDEVDLVYIPLPNHLHEEWVVACAEAGRHVLCEKPLGPDAAAARRMADACRDAGVVLLEAYMTPFHPRSRAVQDAVAEGRIGALRDGVARMSGALPDGDHRWSRANGGGALLDVGIYCLEPILTAAGWDGEPPKRIAASARWAGDVGDGAKSGVDVEDRVDAATSAWLELSDGVTVAFHVDFVAPDQQFLQLTGNRGAVEVHERHATPDRRDASFRLRAADGAVTEVGTGTGDCYEGMLEHVRDVLLGRSEPLRPPSRSVAVARLVDAIASACHER